MTTNCQFSIVMPITSNHRHSRWHCQKYSTLHSTKNHTLMLYKNARDLLKLNHFFSLKFNQMMSQDSPSDSIRHHCGTEARPQIRMQFAIPTQRFPQSLLKKICYPAKHHFSTEAARYISLKHFIHSSSINNVLSLLAMVQKMSRGTSKNVVISYRKTKCMSDSQLLNAV